MTSRTALLALLALGAAGTLVGLSCSSGGTFDSNRQPTDPTVLGDGGADPEAGNGCPEGEPKIGENCPPAFLESVTCTYQVGTCFGPTGAVYPDYLNYCCVKNGNQIIWQACGGMSQCDMYDGGGAAPVDAAAPDASSDAVDGGAG
jgi:hypothetical protein